jgi:hypothetical protein
MPNEDTHVPTRHRTDHGMGRGSGCFAEPGNVGATVRNVDQSLRIPMIADIYSD